MFRLYVSGQQVLTGFRLALAYRHDKEHYVNIVGNGAMAATVEELERRVIALETAQTSNASTLRWVAGTLGQVQGA